MLCTCLASVGLGLPSSSALAARGHSFSSFGEEGAGSGQFNQPSGVAVRQLTGNVYVVDRGNNRVERFSSAGGFLSAFDGSKTPAKSLSSPEGIAIDNSTKPPGEDPSEGDVYVVDAGHDVIDKFNAAGKYLSQVTNGSEAPFGALDGVAVDASGTLWVYQASGEIDSFSNALANKLLSSRTSAFEGTAPGFAVGSEDDLYVGRTAEAPAEVVLAKLNPAGESLIAALDKERTTAAAVDATSDDVYVDNTSTIAVFGPSGEPVERFGSGQLGSGAGLAVSQANGAVYVADLASNQVDVFVPEPPSQPSVNSVYAVNVGPDAADLHALINPHGAETTYYFQYGTSDCASAPEACASIPAPPGASVGSTFDDQPASLHVDGLAPAVTYHYRVLAINAHGTVEAHSQNGEFTTQAKAGPVALPDGRAWEMVSPPDKRGGIVEPLFTGAVEASLDGSAFTYLSLGSLFGEPQGEEGFSQVLATRAPAGWSSADIAVPHQAPVGETSGIGLDYQAFSPDLARAFVDPQGPFTPLSPEASERTPYLRNDSAGACETDSIERTCYQPLLTAANVTPGTKFGGDPELEQRGLVEPLDATPDLSHVVLSSPIALTSTPAEEGGLYEWAGGSLALISVLPPEGTVSPRLGYQNSIVSNAISDHGSRVFWEKSSEGHHLYVRDTLNGETLQLDVVRSGAGEGEPGPRFQTASADGSRVFFRDSQQLVEGAGAPETFDLYECRLKEVAGKLSCELSDLTLDHNPGENAEMHGDVLGFGTNGGSGVSRLYLVARGVLASNQNAATGEKATSGAENLYMLQDNGSGWSTTFIATLSGEEGSAYCEFQGAERACPARVSPNGRYLTFMSDRSLTGYDNADANSGRPDEEVFLYDGEAGANRLRCVSCNPTGARPNGMFDSEAGVGLPLVDHVGKWTGHSLAANIPTWEHRTRSAALYQPRYLSNDGRLFFNSSDALVPQDVNSQWDVYEYEPAGAFPGCSEASETFSPKTGGCVNLVSSGTSSEESAFLDASEEGGDAFFITGAQLTAQDSDSARDVYDAHVCTVSSPCLAPSTGASPPPCSTSDACRPGSSPAGTFETPASAGLAGIGNLLGGDAPTPTAHKPPSRAQTLAKALKTCKSIYRRSRRKRAACERRARTAFRAHPTKRAQRNASRKHT